MPLDQRRSTPQHKAGSRDVKRSFCLLGLAATPLLLCLAVPLSGHFFLSKFPQICAAVCCYLLRPYVVVAVNCMLLVILKRTCSEEMTPEGGVTGEVSLEVWFDAAPSPTFHRVTSNNGESTPPPSLQPNDSSPGGSASTDEPSPTSGYQRPASSPVPTAAVSGINTSEKARAPPRVEEKARAPPPVEEKARVPPPVEEKARAPPPVEEKALAPPSVEDEARAPPPVEEEDDSMDATWKAITGRAAATAPPLKKSNTWDVPPRVQVEPAVKGELRKSETFQEEAALAAARRAVLQRRMQGREVAVVEDRDEMNRRCEAFIKNFNDQLRLQRLASLRRRRYMGILNSA